MNTTPNNAFSLTSQLVDIPARRIYPAKVHVAEGRIAAIEPIDSPADAAAGASSYILPGFIDAHVHIESSMLVPTEFARAAVVHGTVATVSDPHEIGNVLGVAGVHYMLDNAAKSPLKFYFGAPSCVPATLFETAGAEITVEEVTRLLDDPRIRYLSEMMNFPGILNGDRDCLAKVAAAKQRGKPIDGHAPGLRGAEAARYVAAGITTDHECFTKEEALDKLAAGCKIVIREGSAARNFDALYTLLSEFSGRVMLCSDDKHPDELLLGHINSLVRRAVEKRVNVFDALEAACITPITHYGLDVGQLRVGDPADFIEVDSLIEFNVLRTWIDGQLVAENGAPLLPRDEPPVVNNFLAQEVHPVDLHVRATGTRLALIEAIDGQLVTRKYQVQPRIVDEFVESDVSRDLLKLVVVNRYRPAAPSAAFITGFGLQRGAFASSVAHDSHNVIAVGVADDDIVAAINRVMEAGGGLSAASRADEESRVLPLPVAGLMATGTCQEVGAAYGELDRLIKSWGAKMRAPYMTLSFMALLVIPELKLSDQGLFDGAKFQFVPLLE